MRRSKKLIQEQEQICSNLQSWSIKDIIEKYLNAWNQLQRTVPEEYINILFERLDPEVTDLYNNYFVKDASSKKRFVKAYLNYYRAVLIDQGEIVYTTQKNKVLTNTLQKSIMLTSISGANPLIWSKLNPPDDIVNKIQQIIDSKRSNG